MVKHAQYHIEMEGTEKFFFLQHTEFLSRLIQITPPGLTKTFVSPKK